MNNKKKIVIIGGGTGNFVVLSGLKKYYKEIDISVIVDMTDSGGSNKKLIDEFGLLPTSDIKQCLVALSPETSKNSALRKLFNYRFTQGEGIKGHHFGNLFMAALSDIMKSQQAAIEKTQEILRIRGKIIPVSYEKCELVAEYEDGSVKKGEHEIDEPKNHDGKLQIIKLYTKPKVKSNPKALAEIKLADYIIFSPGDIYTSILANVVIGGVAGEIQKSKAKKIYIMNLMTKWGQTYGFKASDHIKAYEEYLSRSLDYVLVNKASIPKKIINYYEKEKDKPVIDNLGNSYFRVIRNDFLNNNIADRNPADKLKRSLIRHDSDKLARVLIDLINK